MSSKQINMVCLEELVNLKHQYRKYKDLFDFDEVSRELKAVESAANYKGYGILSLFKSLLLQFMEDLSDRELERYLSDSNAAKWFCDFELTESTPDYTVFSKLRTKIGSTKLSKIFAIFREQLRSQGYMSEVFTFVRGGPSWLDRNAADLRINSMFKIKLQTCYSLALKH